MATNDNISIRTRIRKASTSINPEFGPSIESLLTFVSASSTQSSWKKKQPDPSIVITPLSILSGSSHSAVSAGGGNGGGGGGAAWRSASPLRSQSAPRGRPLSSSHRNRSFNNNSGHPPLLVRGGPSSHSLSSSVGRRSGCSVTAATAAVSSSGGGASGGGGGGNGNSGGVTTAEEGGTNRLELDLSNEHKLEVEREEEDGMVNISLEEENNNNKSNHHHHHTTTTTNDHGILKGSGGVIMMELETEELSNDSKDDDETREDKELHQLLLLPPIQQSQQRQQRTPSPLLIVRSGSVLSMPSMGVSGGGGQQHDQQHNRSSNNSIVSSTGSSNSRPRSRSINARSRSINKNMRARSRSRGGGDSLTSSGRGGGAGGGALSRGGAISLSGRRMRSAGAANAFNTSTVVCDDNDSMTDHSLYPNQEEEMMMMETMNVLLKDIISVKHETPFSSSKKSDAELHAPVAMVGRATSFTTPPPTTTMLAAPQPLYRPGSKLSTTSQPLSPSVHSGLNCYRIYIHTRTNGYLEFNFDNNSNSYEVVLAYLSCHLKDGMVPPDDDVPVVVGNDDVGSSNAATSKGASSLEQPVNLTRTKSLSNKVTSKDNGGGGGGGGDDATVTSTSTTSTGDKQQQQLPSSAFQPFISQSNSSNPIERLQTKAINRQLEQEHTPMNSIKGSVAGWVSSIIDCANFGCCQDTTVTPEDKSVYNGNGIEGTPLRQPQQLQQQQRVQSLTPTSKVLKSNGIGGLSFEVETVSSNMS